jgi:hypothetical protein
MPDLNNLTIPGATILYFNDGTGERDLGYFEGKNTKVTPKNTVIEYKTNRGGKLRLAKSWSIEEMLEINFVLNSVNVPNMRAFFMGGDAAPVAGGERFAIGANPFIQGAARLMCTPPAGHGRAFELDIPLCQIKPNGDLNLEEKVMELPMSLQVLDNSGATPTYPIGRVTVFGDDGSD